VRTVAARRPRTAGTGNHHVSPAPFENPRPFGEYKGCMATIIPFPNRTGFEPWVTKRELARHLRYSTRWVELRHREGLPSVLMGGRRRYRISEVESWLREERPR
jgi:hypothetical protein